MKVSLKYRPKQTKRKEEIKMETMAMTVSVLAGATIGVIIGLPVFVLKAAATYVVGKKVVEFVSKKVGK